MQVLVYLQPFTRTGDTKKARNALSLIVPNRDLTHDGTPLRGVPSVLTGKERERWRFCSCQMEHAIKNTCRRSTVALWRVF